MSLLKLDLKPCYLSVRASGSGAEADGGDGERAEVCVVPSELRAYGVWDAAGSGLMELRDSSSSVVFFALSDAQARLLHTELSALHEQTAGEIIEICLSREMHTLHIYLIPRPSLAPPCPFILVHLIGRLDELQEATLASLMEMMALRSGHPSLGTALSREEGLKRALCHPHGAHFLTLLGNKVTNRVSPCSYTQPLYSGAVRSCRNSCRTFQIVVFNDVFFKIPYSYIPLHLHIRSSDLSLFVYRKTTTGPEAENYLRLRIPDTHYAAIQDSQACPKGALGLNLYSFCTNHSITCWKKKHLFTLSYANQVPWFLWLVFSLPLFY